MTDILRVKSSHRALSLITARTVGLVLGVVATALVARRLGPGNFATFSLATTLVVMTNLATDFGATPIVIRELNSNNQPELIPTLTLVRTIMGFIAGSASLMVALALTHSTSSFTVCAIILATAPLSGLTTGMIVAQAHSRIYAFSAFALLQSTFWTLAAVCLYVVHASPVGWALGFSVSSVATGTAIYAYRRRAFPTARRAKLELARAIMREAWVVGLATFVILAYHRIDYLIVYEMEPRVATGIYAAAFRVLDQAFLVPTAIMSVAIPRIASSRRLLRSVDARRETYRGIVLVASALGVMVFAAPRFVLEVGFGPDFLTASGLLRILAGSLPPMAVSLMAFQLSVLDKRSGIQCRAAMGVLAVTIAITVPLVYAFGTTGAAISTVCTEALAGAWFLWNDRGSRKGSLSRLGLSAIVNSWTGKAVCVMGASMLAAYELRGREFVAESVAVAMVTVGVVGLGLMPRRSVITVDESEIEQTPA